MGSRAPLAWREAAFDPDARARIEACLARLSPHVDHERIALTGGVAIQLHLCAAGAPGGRGVADVDLVASGMDAVEPSAAREFLLAHFHVPHAGHPKFMIQLVDSRSRLRIDIFPDLAGSIARAHSVRIGGVDFAVLDAASILDHKLRTLALATREHQVDVKHLEDSKSLAAVLGRRTTSIAEECLVRETYGKDLTACRRCEISRRPDMPLADRQAIFDVLGYN